MATTIITKNGSGAPVAGDLVQGELAVDLTNKTLYSKDSSGNVFKVGDTGGGSPGTFTDLVATNSFTSPGIDDNATSTAITIDANENVGIKGELAVVGSSGLAGYIKGPTGEILIGEDSSGLYLGFGAGVSPSIPFRYGSSGTTYHAFNAGGSEKMRIDASGTTTVTGGFNAAQPGAGAQALALGVEAGLTGQAKQTVAVGYQAGYSSQGERAVAVGRLSGVTTQGLSAVAVGNVAGNANQGIYSVAIGTTAGQTDQGDSAVAIGNATGNSGQGNYGVAVGSNSGTTNQGISGVAIGNGAGSTNQSRYSTALGYLTGNSAQGEYSTALGFTAGQTSQGDYAVALGSSAGKTSQGQSAIAVGNSAGFDTQGTNSIAVGVSAGQNTQGGHSVAIGYTAGFESQQSQAVAIGREAGKTSQSANAISVGRSAGLTNQGADSIAIGTKAGELNQAANGIIINSSGAAANTTNADHIWLNSGANKYLFYNGTDAWTFRGGDVKIPDAGLLVGQTSTNIANIGASLLPSGRIRGAVQDNIVLELNRKGSDGGLVNFYNDTVVCGVISCSGLTTSYGTSSDERLKENIVDAPAGNIDSIKVCSFDWKADGTHQEYGFIAQELETVAPYAVIKGETDEDMWSVDYSKLVPMLVKEIQNLKAEVAALKGA